MAAAGSAAAEAVLPPCTSPSSLLPITPETSTTIFSDPVTPSCSSPSTSFGGDRRASGSAASDCCGGSARAVAVAFLVLPLQRLLPTLPTRVGLRLFPPIAFPPISMSTLFNHIFILLCCLWAFFFSVARSHSPE